MTEMPLEFDITPEPPYDIYGKAHVYFHRNRRLVAFTDRIPGIRASIPDTTSYARYLYQVDLWKKAGEWIAKDMEVDHINDDSLDDRLSNYQLLTRLENLRKRDLKKYRPRTEKMSPGRLDALKKALDDRVLTWERLCREYEITPGHLRYLVRTHFPDHKFEREPQLHLAEIEDMLKRDWTQRAIADFFDVDQATISRLVSQHFPKLLKTEQTKEKAAKAVELLGQGKTLEEISTELGGSGAEHVIYWLKRYYPNAYQRWRQDRNSKKAQLIARVDHELNLGKPQWEAAEAVGLTQQQISKIVLEHLPHHQGKELKDYEIEHIVELRKSGKEVEQIARLLKLAKSTIYNVLRAQGYGIAQEADAKRARRNARIGELLKQGLKYTEICQELLREFGETVSEAGLSSLITRLYPEHGLKTAMLDRLKKVKELSEQGLSTVQIGKILKHSRSVIHRDLKAIAAGKLDRLLTEK